MLTTSFTLLERVRDCTDQVAWERLVSLYTPFLCRWTRLAGLRESDVSDLVQEVFVVLAKELPHFVYDHQKRSFRGWLKTIAINKCHEWKRKRNLAVGEGGSHSRLSGISEPNTLETLWDEEYERNLVGRAMEIMQSEFDQRIWRACWEHVVSGCSAADVGEQFDMSEAAVYMAKSRVLKRLRQELRGLLE